MLHRFIHKKALLTNINDSSLIEIQNQFNNIFRKVFGCKTLLQLFTKYLKRVALQTRSLPLIWLLLLNNLSLIDIRKNHTYI